MNRNINHKGFTLIELLVCVACMGILSAIAFPEVEKYRIRARNAVAVSNMRNLISAQETYYVDNHRYAQLSSDHADTTLQNAGLTRNDDVILSSYSPAATQFQVFFGNSVHAKGSAAFSAVSGRYHCYYFDSSNGLLTVQPDTPGGMGVTTECDWSGSTGG
ncbi:prepilin-type N-terminal cleavage/methylation domain-containing protein [bacterium]|nr:prepilin-type N-terminal cleavage/methylation domain-containing protein [bacterium]